MEKKMFKKGEVIFREGEADHSMFEIHGGKVGIYGFYGTPDEKKLVELNPGDSFGEMSVLAATVRSATAVAEEDGTELMEITADSFDAYLKENPEKIKRLLTQMSRRIQDLGNDYLAACKTVADIREADTKGEAKEPELQDRMTKIVSIYQNRFPALFNITMKEAKDDVRFVFDASAR